MIASPSRMAAIFVDRNWPGRWIVRVTPMADTGSCRLWGTPGKSAAPFQFTEEAPRPGLARANSRRGEHTTSPALPPDGTRRARSPSFLTF